MVVIYGLYTFIRRAVKFSYDKQKKIAETISIS